MKTLACVASCLFAVLLASAPAPASAAAGWTTAGAITELNQQPGASSGYNSEVFVTATITGSLSGCSSSTGFYFLLNDERHKRMFAMLLSAQASGRQVKLYVTGTCHTWGSSFLDGVIVVS